MQVFLIYQGVEKNVFNSFDKTRSAELRKLREENKDCSTRAVMKLV